jgi:HAE1 family hydrophobic/amphiphilic exporter-1
MRGIRQLGEFDVEVELRAPRTKSMESIAEVANQVRARLKDLPMLTKLDVSLDVSKPEYQVRVDRVRARELGLTAADVARTVRTYIDGAVPTRYHEGGYYYDLRVTTREGTVNDRATLEALPVPLPGGANVSLASVAEIVPPAGPTEIDRYDQMRMIKVTADGLGLTPGEANGAVAAALADFQLPPGYTLDFGGQAREMRRNFRSLGLVLGLALFFAYVILAIQFESFSLPFVVMVRVPLSLIGVSPALFLTGKPIGATVMIGIVILAGIEVNHGVVLLSYVRELERAGRSLRDAVLEGALARLRPVVMALLVGEVGLLPLALGLGEGTELLQPMAIAVIGGLLFSLFLTFLFMPAAYLLSNRRKKEPTPWRIPQTPTNCRFR